MQRPGAVKLEFNNLRPDCCLTGLLSEYDQDIRFQLLQGNTNSAIDDSSESEVEPYHPLTPPPSDYSDSRPISPLQSSRPVIPSIRIVLSEGDGSKERSSRKGGLKRRNRNERTVQKSSLTLSLISKDASKNAIAVAATLMSRNAKLQRRKNRSRKPFTLTVNELEGLLEGEHGLSSPDFMIVHSLDVSNTRRKVPLELYNFPPWHIRLTEIHHSRLTLSAPYHASETCYSLDETVFREALDEFAGAEFRFGK
ncbi:hyphal tip 1 [Coprinopsis cinerea okayama7|uniref:ditrans,polycis-polyprenyl diphosphate synthase [(2E,6E)-farnesyldiphosphate specific] n=1 Tax=Coprinopsis cinerea (strain Okayama-7 / 130 / ATCC MYA-4618 / FGSC 9003) TaxID=240176 RepID=A8N1D6_COPC7|nr:hyphal tip 1 [Coprinopsis cinerea okayama7\|eukprot:XP_001828685.2 hyphal tip 1 [Coprinopsis cinerea okayama7\